MNDNKKLYFKCHKCFLYDGVTEAQITGSSGVHRPPVGQGRNGVMRARSWTGGVGGVPPRLGVSRFTILSRFFVMFVFLFCKLSEH